MIDVVCKFPDWWSQEEDTKWPTVLTYRPHIGEHIRSLCGKYKARITEIVHNSHQCYFNHLSGQMVTSQEPYLELFFEEHF